MKLGYLYFNKEDYDTKSFYYNWKCCVLYEQFHRDTCLWKV